MLTILSHSRSPVATLAIPTTSQSITKTQITFNPKHTCKPLEEDPVRNLKFDFRLDSSNNNLKTEEKEWDFQEFINF
ncbi:predicted protein [Histoplasma mississippiense (nom. inval.)]|uniref:predicted protein n=1 Tax=Ajellomyces capsulatus (strain NAm1 / WU24) TaxID=2059318 RepID=UPI000157B771|nr:predicted protein [Histoplasma mississippiense (nom. inval.)]EDN03882.1 predicted protein [Histoplasma mississippiense (nom. inval.)]